MAEEIRSVTLCAEIDTNKRTTTRTFALRDGETTEQLGQRAAEWLTSRLDES